MFRALWRTHKKFLIVLGLIVAVALMMTLREGNSRDVGLFILGGAFSTGTAFLLEEVKRTTKAQDTALALHVELSQLVARCCFDFQSPWSGYYKQDGGGMDAERVRKFSPNRPVIYPSTASDIALLPNAAQALVEFYSRLGALQRAIDEAARDIKHVRPVAVRMRQALPPGLKALKALGSMVEGAEKIEDDAFTALGEALGKPAPALPLRATIEKLLNDYPPKM
jgi:hypothetical protein